MKISEAVKNLQWSNHLRDDEMVKALSINWSTLGKLKRGVFDSEAQILQEIQNKVEAYLERGKK